MMAVPSVEVQQVVVDASGKVVVAFDTVLPPADDSIYMYQCQTGQENGHLASSRYPVFAKPASVDLPLISSFFFLPPHGSCPSPSPVARGDKGISLLFCLIHIAKRVVSAKKRCCCCCCLSRVAPQRRPRRDCLGKRKEASVDKKAASRRMPEYSCLVLLFSK